MSLNLKKQLRHYLDKHDLSVLALSKRTGVPNATLTEWLKGRSPKKVDQVRLVAAYFKTTIDNLCFGVGDDAQEQVMDFDEVIGDKWLSGVFEVRLRRVKKGHKAGSDD